jgi:4-carboxymuconolactone decarboxylase
VPLARKAGIAAETIETIRERRPIDDLPEAARAVVLYVQQLLRNNRVETALFDQLLKTHDPKWMVELTSWIGRYAALSGILNAFEVTPATPVEILPDVPSPVARPKVRPPLAAPRVTPITRREQLAGAYRPVFDAIAEGRGGNIRGPFPYLLYSPELSRRHLAVGSYLRYSSQLKPEPRELAIIATAREKDCSYVWAAHAPAARKAGVSEAAVTAVRDRGDITSLPAGEREIVDYARQLWRRSRVAQPLFDRLRDQHGVTWLVELTALIGHYGIVSGILNAFEVAPAPDAEPLPLA